MEVDSVPKRNSPSKFVPSKQKGKKVCTNCHREHNLVDYYLTYSPLFSLDKRVPICKDCCVNLSLNIDGTINLINLKDTLRIIDKPFYIDTLYAAHEKLKSDMGVITDNEVGVHGAEILTKYFTMLSMKQNIYKTFKDSERTEFINNQKRPMEELIRIKSLFDLNKQKEQNNDLRPKIEMLEPEEGWCEQDRKNMEYVIEVVGYDPFENYPDENRRFLFNSLIPYLEDEDNVDDVYKLSQIIQIVDNNNQIRICNKKIANLDPIENVNEIQALQGIKKDLTSNNDKIAKENEISVKNRSNKDAGKSTLTFLMRKLREMDFDKAEEDYYDQLRGEGSQWAISISQKAMLDHCLFDEADKKEIYETNLKLINDLYNELDDKKEKVRLLLKKIDSLNLEIEQLKANNGLS